MKQVVIIAVALFVGSLIGVSSGREPLRKIPDGLVVLTFDDCNKSDRSFVAKVLKEKKELKRKASLGRVEIPRQKRRRM